MLNTASAGDEFFTSRVFLAWIRKHKIRHLLSEPERPMQNGYIESFNGKYRDECLNEHWFTSLARSWPNGDATTTRYVRTAVRPDRLRQVRCQLPRRTHRHCSTL